MSRTRRRVLRATVALGASALGFAGCATPPLEAPPATPPAFVLERESAPGRLLLIATLHAGPPASLPPELARAFDDAERVLVEVDAEARATAIREASRPFALLPDGATLDDVLDAPVRDALARAFRDRPGTLAAWRRLRPWALALLLPRRDGTPPTSAARGGLDRVLLRRARARGVPIVELEAADAQVRAIADGPLEEQVRLLELRLAQRERGEASFDRIADAWRRGDLDALASLKDLAFPPEGALAPLRRRLFAGRDEAMADALAAELERPAASVALLGAFHLAGPDAIQHALARRGVRVVPFDAVALAGRAGPLP